MRPETINNLIVTLVSGYAEALAMLKAERDDARAEVAALKALLFKHGVVL